MKIARYAAGALIILSAATVHAYQEGDFQIWNTDAESVTIVKGAKLAFEQELRWWNDATELHYQHYDFGLVLSPNKYFDLGFFYRQIYERRKSGGKFMPEECPNVNVTGKIDLWGFGLEDRNRFEYRHFSWQDDNCRYRNKVTVRSPWKFTPLRLNPYVANEIFVRLDDNAVFNQNRFSAGFGLALWKDLKGEIYYMRKSDRGRVKWTDANILGLALKAAF